MFSETSYPFAVGVIKAKESTLIDAAMWARLREASLPEALRLLTDSGYGEGVGAADIDELIRAELGASQQMLIEIAPDPAWIGVLLLPTDAHNMKVLFKGRLLDSDETALLLDGGAIDRALLTVCIQNADYKALPAPLDELLGAIERTLTPDTRAYELSAAVDNAVYAYALSLLHGRRAEPFVAYVQAKIDVTNTLSLLRAKALEQDAAKLRPMLVGGGTLEAADWMRLYTLPPEELRRSLRAGVHGGLLEAVLAAYDRRGEITAAEQAADTGLRAMLGQEKDDSFGIGPLLYYLMQKQEEAKNLRLLFAQKRAAASEGAS